ncbi:MAG: hypothetical protein FWC34_00410 [Bacteroidetes bacterium]|nr:hypothetical protein [Bacteroidota bacterium]
MDEIDYKHPDNPKFFATAHSAWCPPIRSKLFEVRLKRRELFEPSWVDVDGKAVTISQAGERIKMSVKCNEDVEPDAVIVFRMYCAGEDIKTTEAQATLPGKNINGVAQSEELCWGVKSWHEPPEGSNKFFFTAQTRNSPYITSSIIEMKPPEFSNLCWSKENQKTDVIFLHEYITISCDTKNIPDYQKVKVEIYEPDENGNDLHIFNVAGKIEKGKLNLQWKVDFLEEENTKSNKEIAEKGYALPEYRFFVRYYGFKSEASPVATLKCNYVERVVDQNGNPVPNTDYILITPDGHELYGKTDPKGFVRQDDLYLGKCKVLVQNKSI